MCREVLRVPLPSRHGTQLEVVLFRGDDGQDVPVVLAPVAHSELPRVRVHSSCLTGDILGSLRCDCGPQLQWSLDQIALTGGGVIYLPQEGRGIGLEAKLRAYQLQDTGLDTVEANTAQGLAVDAREYDLAAHILVALGWSEIVLLSNNPDKSAQLTQLGVRVHQGSTPTFENAFNTDYLATKASRMNHLLDVS